MKQRIAHVALVVNEYDEAIEFYTKSLGFKLIEDTDLGEGKRWVVISPPGSNESSLLLAKADNPSQSLSIGNQTGGRVSFFLFTDNFERDYASMVEKEVIFVRPPTDMPYGRVAVFEDLYGNMWDLLQPNEKNSMYLPQA